MAKLMSLEILTPGSVVLRVDKVRKVIVQAEDGQLGIFPGHTLMLAETIDGPLTYETVDGEEETISVTGGILKVSGSSVVIFSGGFFDLLDGTDPQFDLDELEAEQEFSRLTTELSRRLKLA